MIASLAMYDPPELAPSNDAFWTTIQSELGFGPVRLTRQGDLWDIWRHPDLLLAQTCGLPYRSHLHGHVQLVGTPDYGLSGCPPGHYHSVFIIRRGDATSPQDYATRRFAYNDPLSQSGWAAPQTHMADLGLRFETLVETGSHAQSARAVAEGRADIAALDGVTWRLFQQHDPLTRTLQVIGTTRPTPGLPYITGHGQDPSALFRAIQRTITGLDRTHRDALGLHGITFIPPEDYLAIPTPPGP